MFGIGLPELLFILALALIVLGPERLPKVAKQLARFLGEVKKTADDFKAQIDMEALRDEEPAKAPPAPEALNASEAAENPAPQEPTPPRPRVPGGAGPDWKVAQGPAAAPEGTPPPSETGEPAEEATEEAPTASAGKTSSSTEDKDREPSA